jgi:hypothetical protein
MSFKLFIYYCALCGGWAAFVAWAVVWLLGLQDWQPASTGAAVGKGALIGGVLGLFVASAISTLDAYANAGGSRLLRALFSMVVGFLGGLLGGGLGTLLYAGNPQQLWRLVIGWMLAGIIIGSSLGLFDLIRVWSGQGESRVPRRKTVNGIIGGLLGGLLGGLPFGLLLESRDTLPRSNLTIGLVILGLCIGLLIGLAQVFFKEAWLKVERGFRAGREVLLTRDETVIGRAEGCEVGVFGDMDIDKQHARIVLDGDRYVLHDNHSARGTFLNDRRIGKPEPLQNGDLIRVGSCYLRFGERSKRG